MNLDLVPAVARGCHRGGRLGIGVSERLLGRVGEDDPEAERLVGTVSLVDLNLTSRILPLEEERREETRGSPTDDRDVHAPDSCMSWPAITRCWISVVPS